MNSDQCGKMCCYIDKYGIDHTFYAVGDLDAKTKIAEIKYKIECRERDAMRRGEGISSIET